MQPSTRPESVSPSSTPMRPAVERPSGFAGRHLGPSFADEQVMLRALGLESLDELAARAVPETIRQRSALDLPAPASEEEALAELRALAARNEVLVPMIGLGYHDTHTPAVIRRNVLENPAWYTAYTPYQPEISQGRLEVLLAFQTMVEDLTGLPVANASMLDEATAAAEAMAMCRRVSTSPQDATFLLDADCHPQTRAVVRTRAEALGLPVVDITAGDALPEGPIFGLLLQYPGSSGRLADPRALLAAARERGAVTVLAADLLALTLVAEPGALGADIAVGTSQRFGVPLGFGGPHAGYLAVRSGLERQLPGRLVGVSVDADGRPAYRLALSTREQHIRRERATSNICTAQVLLAVVAALYAAYHGPDGLAGIARRTHRRAVQLATALERAGLGPESATVFDTLRVRVPGRAAGVVRAAREAGINLLLVDEDTVGVSTDEATTVEHVRAVVAAFGADPALVPDDDATEERLPTGLRRTTGYLAHPVFHEHRSETAMLRYLRRLADKDLALDRTMIPLGSCTMKLNAAAEMEPISWPGFASIHPFAPLDQVPGYLQLVSDLERWLCAVTGYDAVSLQPNAGSQGEFAGLLAIRAYHRSRGDLARDVCLIPASAHGTNAASAAMAGMRVVVVATTDHGDVDLDDLRAKIAAHGDQLAAIMITYPSTHGVYEEDVRELCGLVHRAGGQVYVDGANLNALVGLAQPGEFGADVSHLNLHKTFCIPHGGGGPGVGPVAVRSHLAAFLPGHPVVPQAGPEGGAVGAVSAAPWGSAGILPISWAYVRMMGGEGLTRATATAVLNANYVAHRLAGHLPVLYTGRGGLVAHECVLDLRGLTRDTGITVDDVAKRLMDYGFHAPTMSFPVAGTLMVEPTESEDLAELDRFCDAMIAIRREIDEVARGTWPAERSPLRLAPHTAADLVGDWDRPYDRAIAVFPAGRTEGKYWPPVRRIDGAYGDRNLVCSCPPVEAFVEPAPVAAGAAR